MVGKPGAGAQRDMSEAERLHRHLVGQQGSRRSLNTPALVVDVEMLDRNIAEMAAFADLMDRNRIDVVQLLAAMPVRADEVGRFENPKMLCDRLPRHGKAVAEFV